MIARESDLPTQCVPLATCLQSYHGLGMRLSGPVLLYVTGRLNLRDHVYVLTELMISAC